MNTNGEGFKCCHPVLSSLEQRKNISEKIVMKDKQKNAALVNKEGTNMQLKLKQKNSSYIQTISNFKAVYQICGFTLAY